MEYFQSIFTSQPVTPLTLFIDYKGGTNPVYIGSTYPYGTAADAVWRIQFLQYDSNSNLISITWADSGNFTQIWNDRTSLSYN